jgi:CheY-like chemotaxis protein
LEINLIRLGYNVLTAYDGEAARQQVGFNLDIGVVLSDWEMPGAYGPAVIGEYVKEFPGARTLVIMSTGSRDPKFHAQARVMGAHAVFVKGDNSLLIEAILNPQMYLREAP